MYQLLPSITIVYLLALKNTLDYFLEEYFFKPSAIISYSVGSFGGVSAGNHLQADIG